MDYKVKAIKLPDSTFTVEFHIIDIGGNPLYQDYTPAFVRLDFNAD